MAGAGGNLPHQDKSMGEEQLAARVEEEWMVAECKEGDKMEAAHNTLWTQFQKTVDILTQLHRQEGGVGGGRK